MIIAIENQSTVVTDGQVTALVAALQDQVTLDFAPVWGVGAELLFTARGATLPTGAWQLVILDNSDQANALGYHDVTPAGLPLGKVFAKDDLDAGTAWTVTASHELLEMLGDPDINLCALNSRQNRLYAYEVCDACEDDQFGYQRNGILLSDFVTPAWFTNLPGPYDFEGHVTSPFQILSGGYIGVLDFKSRRGWQQIFADREKKSRRLELRIKRHPVEQ